jgi:hypothetical protein
MKQEYNNNQEEEEQILNFDDPTANADQAMGAVGGGLGVAVCRGKREMGITYIDSGGSLSSAVVGDMQGAYGPMGFQNRLGGGTTGRGPVVMNQGPPGFAGLIAPPPGKRKLSPFLIYVRHRRPVLERERVIATG